MKKVLFALVATLVAVSVADCVGIGKGSENRYTAEVFLNHMLDPKVAVQISEATQYPHCLQPGKAAKTVLAGHGRAGAESRRREGPPRDRSPKDKRFSPTEVHPPCPF